ncbi:MAG: hypothetical protein WC866_01075 [Patescibacteria group bacterium]|jgi:hypothetical protein
MAERTSNEAKRREIEKPTRLVPVPTPSPSGYAMHRRATSQRSARTAVQKPSVPDTSTDEEDDGYPDISVTVENEPDPYFLSEEVIGLLKQPAADPCWCESFEVSIGKIFTGSDDGRFIMLRRPGMSERTLLVMNLGLEQQMRGLMRLAISCCPFDRYKIDSTITHTPWAGPIDQPPLCCDWMAHAALVTEYVRLPSPNEVAPHACFVDDDGLHLPFNYCPRCAIDMKVLLRRRQTFFQSHRF